MNVLRLLNMEIWMRVSSADKRKDNLINSARKYVLNTEYKGKSTPKHCSLIHRSTNHLGITLDCSRGRVYGVKIQFLIKLKKSRGQVSMVSISLVMVVREPEDIVKGCQVWKY